MTYEGQSRDRDELLAPYNLILTVATNIVTMTILQLKTSVFSLLKHNHDRKSKLCLKN